MMSHNKTDEEVVRKKMTSLQRECDVCEQPRHSAQMFQCMICNKKGVLFFVGYCCKKSHTDAAHPLDQEEYIKCTHCHPI